MYKDRRESFGAYLARRRKEWGFSYEQLTEGLCGTERAFRIEKEKREPYKALKDRLLARVGVSPDVYENFLFGSDYDSWKLRQQICGAIMKRDETHAKKLLAQYKELCGSTKMDEASKRLEQQFLLSMEGQLGRLSGESEEKLAKLFREALELTVPEPDGGIRGKALSVHELNLLLEHLRCSQPDNAEERYREILAYIEKSHLDELSRARIYPKTVCYLYHYTKMIPLEKPADAQEDIRRHAVLLRLCNQSIELLQNTGRMYYLWELLSLRENAVKKLASALRRQGGEAGANNLSHLQEENNQLLRVLEQLYGEYGISPKTEDFCFLYVEKEVYCIGDVIRIRRHMLGMSRAELCENICSEKTLRRLENNQLKTQRAIVLDLFDRLGLAAEYCRTELITDSLEAIECMDELRTCIRNWECDRADELIQRIEKLVSMEHPSNRQVILRYQTINRLHQGAVTNEEFCHGLIKTLECTLPLKAAMSSGEKYITNEETLCIQNIASHSNGTKETKQRYLDVLCERYRFYEENGIIASFINMYEIVMECVMSELGNMGEYDQSDKISRTVLKECLHSRRIYGIYKSIYNIWWNNKQQQKEGILLKNRCNLQTDLRTCIALSEFCKNKHQTDFYRKKLAVSYEK